MHTTLVHLGQPAHQRQAYAPPAAVRAIAAPRLVESIEDALLLLRRRNAYARVGLGEKQVAVLAAGRAHPHIVVAVHGEPMDESRGQTAD